jgi:hypothetical protein
MAQIAMWQPIWQQFAKLAKRPQMLSRAGF